MHPVTGAIIASRSRTVQPGDLTIAAPDGTAWLEISDTTNVAEQARAGDWPTPATGPGAGTRSLAAALLNRIWLHHSAAGW